MGRTVENDSLPRRRQAQTRPAKKRKGEVMGEHWLKVSLSELKTVRIVCQCGKGIVELPIDRLHTALHAAGKCRFCDQQLVMPGQDPFAALGAAIENLQKLPNVEVHFVIPDKS